MLFPIYDTATTEIYTLSLHDALPISSEEKLSAKELGMATVPVVRVEELTPEQVDALRIVDNKTNESPWDIELLMEDLPRLDLDAFDFDFALPEIKGEAEDAEEDCGEHEGDRKSTRRTPVTTLCPSRMPSSAWIGRAHV